jgi:DNA-binding transcriptional MerR regulator
MKKYTINDLVKHTGLNRRLIYFYVSEKLLNPPFGKGAGSYYEEEHYLRLMIIKKLRDNHFNLQTINNILSKLSIEDIRNFVTSSFRNLIEKVIEELQNDSSIANRSLINEYYHKPINISFVTKKRIDPIDDKITKAQKEYISSPIDEEENSVKEIEKKDYDKKQLSTWYKLTVNNNLEINVRSDYYSKYGGSIEEIISKFKNIFPEE